MPPQLCFYIILLGPKCCVCEYLIGVHYFYIQKNVWRCMEIKMTSQYKNKLKCKQHWNQSDPNKAVSSHKLSDRWMAIWQPTTGLSTISLHYILLQTNLYIAATLYLLSRNSSAKKKNIFFFALFFIQHVVYSDRACQDPNKDTNFLLY